MAKKGANSLRGGKNKYSAKILVGNYVEDRKDPTYFSRVGGVVMDPRYATTTGLLQQATDAPGGTGSYGGGLKPDNYGDASHNIINYDTTRRGGESWNTVSQTTYGKKKSNEFCTTFHSKPAPAQETLKNYRARWTQETDAMRKVRFVTENRSMLNGGAPASKTRALRKLPGAPKVVEQLQEKVLAQDGRLKSFEQILAVFDDAGDGLIEKNELKWGLSDFGIEFEPRRLDELFNYFDTHDSGKMSYKELLKCLSK